MENLTSLDALVLLWMLFGRATKLLASGLEADLGKRRLPHRHLGSTNEETTRSRLTVLTDDEARRAVQREKVSQLCSLHCFSASLQSWVQDAADFVCLNE